MEDENEAAIVVEEEIEVEPLLVLKQKAFEYETNLVPNREAIKEEILAHITRDNMAPFYIHLCDKLGWARDASLLTTMQTANQNSLTKLDEKQKDADENLGETEVHDAMLERVQFRMLIGDKAGSLSDIAAVLEVVKGTSKRLDLIMNQARLGLVFDDLALVRDNVEKAKEILKTEGDWERRNRLKVYEGMYFILMRDFAGASELFLGSVATFSCLEVMEFSQFIYYTAFVAIPSLSRPDLKSKVIENSEVLSVLPQLPEMQALLNSIYQCQYDKFFTALNTICEMMRRNVWLSKHVSYYYREVRVLVFQQFLASYRSVTLEKMSAAFSIPVDLLDSQLCCFIAANRLTCKIDKINGQIVTSRQDVKNTNYQALVKNGDLLLNKIQKLARIVGT